MTRFACNTNDEFPREKVNFIRIIAPLLSPPYITFKRQINVKSISKLYNVAYK